MNQQLELRRAVAKMTLKYQYEKGVSRKDAFDYVEQYAERVFKQVVFKTYKAFKMFVAHSHLEAEMGYSDSLFKNVSHLDADSDLESQEIEESLTIYRGGALRIQNRHGRLNENDNVKWDEEQVFLQAVCELLNNPPHPHRKWTVEQIKRHCDRVRAERMAQFAQEVAQDSQMKAATKQNEEPQSERKDADTEHL